MLDPHLLREKPEWVAIRLAKRGFNFDLAKYLELEGERKALQVATQALQEARNQRSLEIGQAKSRNEDISAMRAEVQKLSQELQEKKDALDDILLKLEQITLTLPNIPQESVPIGTSENDNLEIRRVGEVPTFDFPVLSHDILGESLKEMDFALASKITGSRFVVLKNQLASLHRALIQFMMNLHTREHGYSEVYVPYIVNHDTLLGTGQLPKFEEDLFKIANTNYYLSSTAEIPVTNIVRDSILLPELLPLRYVCHTPCFRSEAGSYGKDTKGMIRQHQFEKVELVWITTPEESDAAHESLLSHAEVVLKLLELPYRVVELCTADLGASSSKTYDLEVWLPSQNTYREISSCSNMKCFQARRMKARYRDPITGQTRLVHTLNGSGLAVGRTLVAILENYQTANGSVRIPQVLQPYLNGLDLITSSRA